MADCAAIVRAGMFLRQHETLNPIGGTKFSANQPVVSSGQPGSAFRNTPVGDACRAPGRSDGTGHAGLSVGQNVRVHKARYKTLQAA
jgi:hypothetical protein